RGEDSDETLELIHLCGNQRAWKGGWLAGLGSWLRCHTLDCMPSLTGWSSPPTLPPTLPSSESSWFAPWPGNCRCLRSCWPSGREERTNCTGHYGCPPQDSVASYAGFTLCSA